MVLTTRPMRALCLGEVNSGLAEKEAQIGLGEQGGDLPNGVFERGSRRGMSGLLVDHPQPSPPRGQRAVWQVSLTIYAGSVELVRSGVGR
jgi:hypothetical protein